MRQQQPPRHVDHIGDQSVKCCALTEDLASEPTSTSNEPPLPGGWQVATDPSGLPYYYHEATQQTQWTRPEAAEVAAAAEAAPAYLSGSLAEGWEEVKNPTSGTYYYNRSTGETKWDKPSRMSFHSPG